MSDASATRPLNQFRLDNYARDPMWNPFSPTPEENHRAQEEGHSSTREKPATVHRPFAEPGESHWPNLEAMPSTSSCRSSLSRPARSLAQNPGSPLSHVPLRQQMSSTLRQESSLLPVSFNQLRSNSSDSQQAWAWLEAVDDSMPNALLQDNGLAIGSSYYGFEAQRQIARPGASVLGHIQDSSPMRRLAEVKAQSLRFLEIKDGRISRLHCIISADYPVGSSWLSMKGTLATIEDLSTNGTFVNGKRLAKGERVNLNDGDRISLVLSLSPMVERALIFQTGDPSQVEDKAHLDWRDTSHKQWKSKADRQANVCYGDGCHSEDAHPTVFQRMTTSLYTTAETSNPSDLICQICLGPYQNCVAIQPCGHSFCAACLSHHFAAVLQEGQPLNCPLRCSAPQRVVINFSMRQLIRMQDIRQSSGEDTRQIASAALKTVPYRDLLAEATASSRQSDQQSHMPDQLTAATSGSLTEIVETVHRADESVEAEYEGEDSLSKMSLICPLWDGMLPLDASALKLKQVVHALKCLQREEQDGLLTALERLARLAWNDDEVRGAVLAAGGVEVLVDLIYKWIAEPAALCNACLCLMSLVRGEGPQSEASQWKVANGRGVEALVAAATAFPENAAVQLSVLLCIIPLSLDNDNIQAHVASLVLCHVVTALRLHAEHADVQAKGLVVLGVLGQGEGANHDQIRQQQLALGVTGRIAAALETWGAKHEEILWSILFSLAVLVKDGNEPFQPAIRSVAAAGIPSMLEQALESYKASDCLVDEMILSAGAYMLATLQPAATQIDQEPSGLAAWALTPILQPSTIWSWGLR